jgi:hypothetical protein
MWPFLVCLGQMLWRAPRVLWVCRVPALSAIGGGLFIGYLSQTRDMFADLGLEWWQWATFFALVILWAWIVHWAGRHALRLDDWVPDAHVPGGIAPARRLELQDTYRCAAVAIPRILGTAVFAFVALALARTYMNLHPARVVPEAASALNLLTWLFVTTVILGAVFLLLTWLRTRISNWLSGRMQGRLQWPVADGPLLTGHEAIFLDLRRLRRQLCAAHVQHTAWVDLLVALLAVVVTAAFVVSLFIPHWIGANLPRALFVPFVFGSSVLLLTEIGAYAMRRRVPFLLLFVLAGALLSLWNDRFHDVRWVDRAGSPSRITMDEAIKQWRSANDCLDTKPCPSPIIIAASGGGSRAAFMTATVLGAILDLENAGDPDAKGVRKRIFGLSTVSGSSVAAAVIAAALHDAQERKQPDQPPCKQGVEDRAWFAATRKTSENTSWRDCLQKIVAGDVLSPVLVGLIYRDTFPLPNPVTKEPLWGDRAALLEQAMERRYNLIVTGTAEPCPDDGSARSGLCRHLGDRPDPTATGVWQPFLFVNGTSVATGQRIIASEIAAASRRPDGEKSLFPLAFDLCEVRSKGPCPDADAKSDIRLSTAFTMSARFPVISPHGNLRNEANQIVDRIVDGGYFENDGLATAADVADTLKELNLEPVIILITNEPEPAVDGNPLRGPGQPDLRLPDSESSMLFETFTAIGRALYATRSGHEAGDVEYAKSVVGADHLFHVAVRNLQSMEGQLCRPQTQRTGNVAPANIATAMRDLSVSWWMSQPEQAFLDDQLCDPTNNNEIVEALRMSPKAIAKQ